MLSFIAITGVHVTAERHDSASSSGWRAIVRVPRAVGHGLIKAYRYTLSPLIGSDCRHLPTCSEYSEEAIGRFGLWAGGWMTLARLCRCHPWGTRGLDFVPERVPAGARWFLPWRYGRWRGTNQSPHTANQD
jgi:putative membrane protein insertion efficiency factor